MKPSVYYIYMNMNVKRERECQICISVHLIRFGQILLYLNLASKIGCFLNLFAYGKINILFCYNLKIIYS